MERVVLCLTCRRCRTEDHRNCFMTPEVILYLLLYNIITTIDNIQVGFVVDGS